MTIARFLLISILFSATTACSSDSGNGDGGVTRADGPLPDAAVTLNIPASGLYKITAYMPVADECMFGLGADTNSTDPAAWVTVTVDGTSMKVGKPRGTPAMAALGEGTIAGPTVSLSRSNHVQADAPATCNYDEVVTSTATFDDPTKKTFGLGVIDKLTNRRACDTPAGVGVMCTTTWSWRLTFMQ